jgi:hypothetical protein
LHGAGASVRSERAYAERALAIKETLDTAATEIWTTYDILASIAEPQGDADATRRYRQQERSSYAAALVSWHMVWRHWAIIAPREMRVTLGLDPAGAIRCEGRTIQGDADERATDPNGRHCVKYDGHRVRDVDRDVG